MLLQQGLHLHIPHLFQQLFAAGTQRFARWFSLKTAAGSIWLDRSPVRAELFSVERLETHAQTLAHSQPVTRNPIRVPLLAQRLTDNAAVLLQAFRTSTAEVEAGRAVVPAAEWLLDNYHVVEQHIREIRDHLPAHFYRQLPKLATGPFAGYPRVFGVAWAYVAHTDSHFDPVILQRFLKAYQQEQPLTIGELWALSLTLRIVLVENLRRLADQISVGLAERRSADKLALLLQQNVTPLAQHQALATIKLPLSDVFAAQMAKRLRDADPGQSLALDWLSAQLGAQGSDVDQVVQHSQQRLGASNLSVRNVMTSMQRISAIDWALLFEQVSLVELRLCQQKTYPLMDFASRNMYRSAIEVLARGSDFSEQQIAQMACEAATAAETAGSDMANTPMQDVGYYLLGAGRSQFEQQLKFQPNWRLRLNNLVRRAGVTGYLAAIAAVTLILLLAAGTLLFQVQLQFLAQGSAELLDPAAALKAVPPDLVWWVMLALLAVIPFSELATALCQRLFSYAVGPVILPGLAFADGVPAEYRTLVVVPMLLTHEADILAQAERLEVHHLSGCSGDLTFALLTDYLDANEQHGAADLPLLDLAIGAIAHLNQRYPAGPAGPRFLLLHRQRLYNPGEKKWMGWERKRGKLTELNALLRGASDTSFIGQPQLPVVATSHMAEAASTSLSKVLSCWVPKAVRYVITLDADTQLPRNAAFRLIGKMAHPLNRPQFDPVSQRISSGYGILQPRVTPALALDHVASRYQRLYTGPAGIDPYAAAASDLYQDLFGEGSFTGKGIYDVDAFSAALSDRIGENAMLSHDLFEGVFARSGLASDVDVVEDFPARYEVAAKRQHRWVRGDWQLLPWLLRSLLLPSLELPQKLPALGRWKMLDNLRRSLVSPTLLAALFLLWCAPFSLALSGTLLLLLTLFIPNLLPLWGSLWPQHSGIQWRSHLQQFTQDLHLALCRFGMSSCLLVDESWRMVSAISLTLWRLAISRSHLLQWTTSAQTDRAARLTMLGYYQSMWFSACLSLLAALALCSQQSLLWLLLLPLVLSWLAAPMLVWWLSQPQPQFVHAPLSLQQQQQFRLIARRTWRYFETFVTAHDHFLPPDNFQQQPKAQLAHRTSPTNIGLYLLAILSARDFGWISVAQALERLQQTFATLTLLTRYRGHFLNWYDSSDLRVLPPAYVSAVDSGNLAGHLITLANGCELWAQARTYCQNDLERQLQIQSWCDQLLLAQQALVKLNNNQAYCCRNGAGERVLPLLQQLQTGLSQLLSQLQAIDQSAVLSNEILASVQQAVTIALDGANRLHNLVSFESPLAANDDMTPLTTDVPGNMSGSGPETAAETHSQTPHNDPELAHQSATLWFYLTALHDSLLQTSLDQDQLPAARQEQNQQLFALAKQARQLALEMDFAFLLAPDRDLLSIGYALETNQLDESCYDLLASEARLASLFAIAKGDASSKHWFRLGRSATPLYRASALLSWSGSMFEYLMPSLVMRAPAGSLLEQTNRLVVARQIEYASTLQIPWGISESSYNARDLELTYQYSNFGVPGLGLKRGLAENLVIAPYATALGAMVQPVAAIENFDKLAELGACGRYGFVEAIDFTKSRLRQGQRFALVYSFMAHHQGMTLVAIANLLQQGQMRRRFHREPMIQACELLLQERLPRHIAVNHPRAEEAKVSGVRDGIEVLTERRLTAQEHGAPVCHLLSNGHYALMLTAAGTGYSRWRHIAITRWQEDSTMDAQGSFILLRDVKSGSLYSPSLQPLPEQVFEMATPHDHQQKHQLTFGEDRAEFFVQSPDLMLNLDVLVCAEDDGEVRRLTLVNRGNQSRQFDVMSYAELVLTTVANDLAHPAFAKMFVQTEFDAATGALLATRRLRSDRETTIWVAHFVVVEASTILPLQYQTSRAMFFGEAANLAEAQALRSGKAWSDATGTVLDPVFAIKQRIELAPGKTARLAFWTLVAESRAELLLLVDRHNERSAFERAAMLAWTQAQVQLRYLAVNVAEAADFQRLAAPVLYADGRFRAPMAAIMRGAGAQSGLWQHSISGDLPIVLCHIDDIEDLACLKQLLQAHEYWGLKRLAVDFVIINEHAASYVQDLQGAIENLVRNSQSRRAALVAQRNGKAAFNPVAGGQIYPLRADLMSVDSRALIQSVARVVLYARRGLIGRQLGRLPQVPMQQQLPQLRPLAMKRAAATPVLLPVILARPQQLEFDNGLAGFGLDGREYQIQQTGSNRTPMPWLNVIANQKFGFQVSADGSGYSWAINSREFQLTPWSNDPISDPIGEVLYVRDEQSLHWSCATAKPKRDGGSYHCSHGVGYSRFEHQQQELALTLTQFVVMDEALKISRLTIKNLANRERNLSITGYVDWVLGRNRSLTAATLITEFDSNAGFVLVRNPWSGAFGENFAFVAFSVPASSWTCDRTEFIGRHGSLAAPQALRRRNKLSASCGAGLDPCAALQLLQTLAAGGETDVIFMLGQASSVAEAQALVQRFSKAGAAEQALAAVAAHWQPLLGAVQVKTPDRALDIMLNGWLLYQTLACRIYARSAFYQSSGAYGFRDQLQDGMALSLCAPAITRQHLLRAAGRQFTAGDVQHWWLPHTGEGVRSRISDDRIWLVFACTTYVNSSGDSSVWQERVGFLVGPPLNHDQHDAFFQPMHSDETATLFEHCGRALDQSLSLLGEHGLPLMGGGDWNDGMDQVGIEGRGESVWLGWFVVKTLKLFLPLALKILADDTFAVNGYRDKLAVRIDRWQSALTAMIEALEQHSWDGEWYRRATYDNGSWLGSTQSDECQLDSIAQSFAQLSGAADPTRAAQAMDSVLQKLWLKPQQMLLLFKPPFDQTSNNPGYIKGYPPGLRENGGQYSHAAMWVVLALTSMRRGFEAHQLLAQLNPIAHALDKTALQTYQVEPYVVAADVYSVAPHQGRGGWTWYTGAAGWMYRSAIEGLLGIRRQGDSLWVKPCLPPQWPGYSAEIVIEQSRYQLNLVQLTAAEQVASLQLDGLDVSTQPQYFQGMDTLVLPLDGKSHQLRWEFRSEIVSAADGATTTTP
ncbi:glycosyl transferase [Rheinheimera sp. SA_1]|nr:glycosyl transferase [Rheinheimera sp. SA_1]